MKPCNLLYSLYKREHSGHMNLKKPISSFTLSEKIDHKGLSDIFLGFSINCDFVISLTFEYLDVENFYTHSYSNIYLNFNSSPLFSDEISTFHRIYLGQFQRSVIHTHFYQNVLNEDFFLLTITELDCEILVVIFGNLPQLHCKNCQNRTCNAHGIIGKQSYQLPISQLMYDDKFHQVTTVYQEDNTLVIVVADCESNVRFINFRFPESMNNDQIFEYPRSMFPFCLSVSNNKIIENECTCFYDDYFVNENCQISRTKPFKCDFNSKKCQLCLSKFINENNQLYYHKELSRDIIDKCHDIDESSMTLSKLQRILLKDRESVITCKPCNKKSFLTDLGASYQNLILYKLNLGNSIHAKIEYDSIHGETLGSSNADGSNGYQWVSSHIEASKVAIMTEELVINSGFWFGNSESEVIVHCLGMATGKLSPKKHLLIHIIDEINDCSYLVELDVSSAKAEIILQKQTCKDFCKFVRDAKACSDQLIFDLNNDLQVNNGNSLKSITDFSGLIELKY